MAKLNQISLLMNRDRNDHWGTLGVSRTDQEIPLIVAPSEWRKKWCVMLNLFQHLVQETLKRVQG